MSQVVILFFLHIFVALAQKNPNFVNGRSTIVHLFEWKWSDIADECEQFLQYKGYGGVQISPPNEYLVVYEPFRPWWERYQPVSYIINSRSGDENDFLNMTRRCNAVGVRIYVDVGINHMTRISGTGTAGNNADREGKNYPAIPYGNSDFHDSCKVNDYQNATNIRNCELDGLADLDQGINYVRTEIIKYLNHLIDLGVAGFRIDAAKHMWPKDLEVIYSSLKNLSTEFGFTEGSRAFIYQEVIDFGGEAVSKNEYTGLGAVCEFQYGLNLAVTFQLNDTLANLVDWGTGCCNLTNSSDAVAFIDNHKNQRTNGSEVLTYKNARPYIMAVVFMLAHPYGTTKIISSYSFDSNDQGPPQDEEGNLISPSFNEDDTCGNGYICEHRWRQIYNMVGFKNAVDGTEVENWWTDGEQQIAFSRGNKGFIAFTNFGDIWQYLYTGLPGGTYCDIISGNFVNGSCTGKYVYIGDDGYGNIFLGGSEFDPILAFHVNAKLEDSL